MISALAGYSVRLDRSMELWIFPHGHAFFCIAPLDCGVKYPIIIYLINISYFGVRALGRQACERESLASSHPQGGSITLDAFHIFAWYPCG